MNAKKQRWTLGMLMSSGILINYLDRVNISHALIPISEELNLSVAEQGIILSAFSWGYVVFMSIGGILVDRFGPIKMAAISASFWSIATAISGTASSYLSMLLARFSVGIGEAPIFPANARIVKDEFPLEERGRATALFDAGSYIGTALAAPIIVYVMLAFGWRVTFFACASIGLIWVYAWLTLAPQLTKTTDKNSLLLGNRLSRKEYFGLLRKKKILGASYGFFCYNYAKSFFLTWFPAYLVTERGFSFVTVGIVGMIPAIFAVIGELISGTFTDLMIRRGWSVTIARKLPLCLGLILSVSIVFTELIESQIAIISILSFSFAATIAASPSIWAIPGDIAPSPNFVGTIGGIQNTFSNIAGIVAPIITGLFVSFFDSFLPALVFSSMIALSGAISYWFIVGDLVPINPKETSYG